MSSSKPERRKVTNPEWSRSDFQKAVPASKALPDIVGEGAWGARGRGRPPAETPKKMVSIRLDPSLIEAYKLRAEEEGRPYQTLIQEVLTRAAPKPKPKRASTPRR